MEDFGKEVSEVAFYLQQLAEPPIVSEVQDAVSRKDEVSFAKVCEKIRVPHRYMAMLTTIAFSVSVLISWPPG